MTKLIFRQKPAEFWMEISCHQCAKTGPGTLFTRRAPIKGLTQEAQDVGWRLRTDGRFECPECTKKFLDLINKGNFSELFNTYNL